jgi:hypothetical protein
MDPAVGYPAGGLAATAFPAAPATTGHPMADSPTAANPATAGPAPVNAAVNPATANPAVNPATANPAANPATANPATAIPAAASGLAATPQTDAAGRTLAAPAVTATPLATGVAATSAAALAAPRTDGPPPPTDGTSDDASDDDARRGPSGRMTKLHIGWHTVTRSTLREVPLAPATAGLIVGHDRQQDPVPVPIFAPEPVRVALVGGLWAAQLLIFRALALGARVAVVTTEPTAWIGFGERATGQYNRVTVLTGDQPIAVSGTAQQPILAVYDLGLAGPATAPPLGPWRTQLTILRQLDKPGVPALQEAQLILLQRLGGDEAALAASALRLRRHSGQFLQFMADDMIALIGDGTERYVWLGQTPVEQQYAGQPRR